MADSSTDDAERFERLSINYFDDSTVDAETEVTSIVYQMQDGSAPIVIEHAPKRGLAFKVWNASCVLARHLEVCGKDFRDKRTIELGAGVGLAGIAMSRLGANVLLTDLASVVPLLEKNVSANCTGNVAAYCWGDDASALSPPFDYIIGADIIYNEDIFEPLLKALLLLMDEHSVAIISYVSRWKRTNRFFRMLRKHFDCAIAPEEVVPQEILPHAMCEKGERAIIYYITRRAAGKTRKRMIPRRQQQSTVPSTHHIG